MKFQVRNIISSCGATLLGGSDETWVSGLSWDSRTVESGDVYLAIPGERVDGHTFCVDAAKQGAKAVLISHALSASDQNELNQYGVATLLVDDTIGALQKVAAAWRAQLGSTVIALTGSSGKTSTKNLLAHVLARAGSVVATHANQNNELGVPATILSADLDTDYIVVEMGMRGAGQIAGLCNFVQPNWALVTNAGSAHIELLGSRKAIAQAKCEAYQALGAGGVAFINANESELLGVLDGSVLHQAGVACVFFNGAPQSLTTQALGLADISYPCVWASDITLNSSGCASFIMHAAHFGTLADTDAGAVHAPCTLQLAGLHNVSNAVAAAAVGLYAGLSLDIICETLATSQSTSGRQHVLHGEQGATIIDDAYNANPESMCASLETFNAMSIEGARIAVLGDMLELGSYAREGHERVGVAAAKCDLSKLICVGPLAQIIAEAARRAGMEAARVVCVETADQALAEVQECLTSKDAVLVKASHSVGLGLVVEGLVETHV